MKQMIIVPEELRRQALAFPDAVEKALAIMQTPQDAKDALNKALAFQKYADQLKAGIEIEKPIAIGVLKIKAKLGELSPPETGGRGKKTSAPSAPVFAKHTIAAYRKLAKHREKLAEWCETVEDVPTQGEFLRFVSGAHVGHNSGQNEWYTPAELIASARKVMGGIDLDPASCDAAQEVVAAERYFTDEAGRCGLTSDWYVGGKLRVWMNPPYAQPLIAQFCEKLAAEWDAKHIAAACVLVNNATETEWFHCLLSRCSAICFPRGRVKFWHPERASANPLQGQSVIYLGSAVATFTKEFSRYGRCFRS